MGSTLKYWVKPDIENRIKAGQVRALFDTRVTSIDPHFVHVSGPPPGGEPGMEPGGEPGMEKVQKLPAVQVFALTGYPPDFTFLRSLGIQLDPATNKPAINAQTLESNVPGLYLAGVVIGGNHTSEIFIENGRFHGKQIVAALTGKTVPAPPAA
jgi:thioredoxin reductase (NADPH)